METARILNAKAGIHPKFRPQESLARSSNMKRRTRMSVAAFFAMMLPVLLGAQQQTVEVRPAKLEFTSHTLTNGLKVILLENHAIPVINLQMWYHVGSKDEQPGHTGFAHLFEHLMFKGSAHVGPDEHSRIIEEMGGFDNAETNDDTTNFFETFPSNNLERVLWLEADRLGSLNVDEANFKSERQVVEEERRVRVDNQPYGSLEQDLRAAAFTVHG
jgi:zinc protease